MFSFFKKLFTPKLINAALAWQQAGNEPASAYWLYAAPVHLVLQRDTFGLVEPAPLPLKIDEAEALTSLFNKHFAADDWVFFWHETQWFLKLKDNPKIQTHAPQAALNKAIEAYLPTGEGAIKWAAFINELQMLLFEHPVNQAREAKGLPAVNSIWCYGLGQIEIKKHAN